MPDIEFLDDELDLGRRRRFPRWAWLVAAAAVGGLIAAAVATRPSPDRHRTGPATPSVVAPSPNFDAAVPAVQDIAIAGGTTWTLYPHRLVAGGRSVTFGDQLGDVGTPRLLPDTTHGRVWAVAEASGPGQVIEFDARTLRPVHVYSLGTIGGAAILDGRLYVVTGPYLIVVDGVHAPRTFAISPTRAFGSVAADPQHRQLVLVDAGVPARLWTYRPGGGLTPIRVSLPVANGSLAVVRGQVWVGGYEGGGGGALVLHVLERTTRPSRPVGRLGPDALVVGTGDRVIWVRTGENASQLWCVDATTGRPLQHWAMEGPVASTTGTAVVATPAGLQHLPLHGCPG